MGKVFFTRHGQTIWNVENKICGATDIELTELGHQQAEELGRKLAEEQPIRNQTPYTSPEIASKISLVIVLTS